jgi:hypothetical protein
MNHEIARKLCVDGRESILQHVEFHELDMGIVWRLSMKRSWTMSALTVPLVQSLGRVLSVGDRTGFSEQLDGLFRWR